MMADRLLVQIREILLVATLLQPLAGAINLETSQYPSEIHLRAGVLHAPPMAVVEEGDTFFSGLQIDLLEQLKVFAAEDGVTLSFSLSQSPPLYRDAFNLIANNCNTTSNPNPLEDCQKFDMIVGDYYSSSERFMRADLSPPWMRSSMATIKYIEKEEGSPDVTTLTEAEEVKATVCVPDGTYLARAVQQKFPESQYIRCDPSTEECIALLKSGKCLLYADDELLLRHATSLDASLALTGEFFNNQYFVWPMKENLLSLVSKLMKKWMYQAVQTATLDELYNQYFMNGQCPIGTAGEHCELKCDPDHGAADRGGVCVCKSAKWTGDDCSIEVQEDPNLISPRLVHVGYGLAGINFALVAVCAAWVFKNRKRSHIQMAQPMFLAMILVGCLISTSSIFAMAQQDAGDGPVPVCAAIPWLYAIGFSLTFGAMYARIRRIHLVLKYAVELKRVTISAQETLVTATLVFAIDVVILTVWTITEPLEWNRTTTSTGVFGKPLESEGYCTSEHWMVFAGLIAVFHFMLMAMACYRCYLARKIPERVSNGKYVAIAMFSQIQIFLVSIPVLIMLGSGNPGITFFIRSFAIWINDFVVLSLIFGDLKYKIYQHDMEAEDAMRLSRKSSAYRIKSDLRRYTRAMRGFSSRLGMGFSTAGGLSDPSVLPLGRRHSLDAENVTSFPTGKEITFAKDCKTRALKCGDESSSLKPSSFHDESTFLGSTTHESETGTSARSLFGSTIHDSRTGTSVRALLSQLPDVAEAKCEVDVDLERQTNTTMPLRPEVDTIISSSCKVDPLCPTVGEVPAMEQLPPKCEIDEAGSSLSDDGLKLPNSNTGTADPPPLQGVSMPAADAAKCQETEEGQDSHLDGPSAPREGRSTP